MEVGKKYKLNCDKVSFGKDKTVYAKKSETVTIISISSPVAIVENSRGERFPCQINELKEV